MKIKQGLSIKDSDQKLAEDYSFSFETSPDKGAQDSYDKTLYPSSELVNYGTREEPVIKFSANNS